MTDIRLATPADAAAVAAIYAPSVTDTATSFELVPPSTEEMAARIASTLTRTPWLVFASGQDVLGYAYASKHRDRPAYQWSVEVSAYVRADCQGRHIGAALYTSLMAVLRVQGFQNAYAGITLPNPGSVALHTKLGFRHLGVFEKIGFKNGEWHDVLWMHAEIAPKMSCPQPPQPLPLVLKQPAYVAALAEGIAQSSRSAV